MRLQQNTIPVNKRKYEKFGGSKVISEVDMCNIFFSVLQKCNFVIFFHYHKKIHFICVELIKVIFEKKFEKL